MQPNTCLLTRSNGIHDDEFNRIDYDLPMHVVSGLQGSFTDCQFSLEASANPAFGPFGVDNVGFVTAVALVDYLCTSGQVWQRREWRALGGVGGAGGAGGAIEQPPAVDCEALEPAACDAEPQCEVTCCPGAGGGPECTFDAVG